MPLVGPFVNYFPCQDWENPFAYYREKFEGVKAPTAGHEEAMSIWDGAN
jgi:hypothetical protein